jgi:YfiH family protein
MRVVTSPLLDSVAGVRHAFFTRHGGVSTGVYESLNVGRGSKDEPADITENRRRCAAHFAVEPRRLQTNYQVHSASAICIEEEEQLDFPSSEGDALVTNLPDVVCGALSADCAPVLLVDPKARVIAAVHAGWKGALGGVTDFALTAMMMDFGVEGPESVVAAVGPCIGPKSYEVGLEFLERFADDDLANVRFFEAGKTSEKRMFDLPAYVLHRLSLAGVVQAEWVGIDTCADEDFFSNRRAVLRREADYGRLLSAIMLEEQR